MSQRGTLSAAARVAVLARHVVGSGATANIASPDAPVAGAARRKVFVLLPCTAAHVLPAAEVPARWTWPQECQEKVLKFICAHCEEVVFVSADRRLLPFYGLRVRCPNRECARNCRIFRPADRKIDSALKAGGATVATLLSVLCLVPRIASICGPLEIAVGAATGGYNVAMGTATADSNRILQGAFAIVGAGLASSGSAAADALARSADATEALLGLVQGVAERDATGVALAAVAATSVAAEVAAESVAAGQSPREAEEASRLLELLGTLTGVCFFAGDMRDLSDELHYLMPSVHAEKA